ncbi:hypothetical protein [Lacticaseibacillus saniviri]|uniref:hypothetical protein n=1 Tax=Lacticaseibacillus saniviri TaxID=931533 RepID=UPI000704CE7E|nr:hypothetical protein [Lacticaseibacillus saniviri]MCG4281317.1 hypothetical protein [Lacticaseibacillus saniviri]
MPKNERTKLWLFIASFAFFLILDWLMPQVANFISRLVVIAIAGVILYFIYMFITTKVQKNKQ